MTEGKVRKKRGKKIGMSEEEQEKFLSLAKKIGFKTKKDLAKFLELTPCGLSLALKQKRLNKYLIEFFELKLLEVEENAYFLEEAEKVLAKKGKTIPLEEIQKKYGLEDNDVVSGTQHFQD